VVSITETVSLLALLTYARGASGFTATPNASAPTAMVVTTVLVAVSMTETVLSREFVM